LKTNKLKTNNYRIIKTKDPAIIKYLLPYFEKLISKSREDYSVESFVKWLRWSISNPLIGVWVLVRQGNKLIKNDTRPIGYAIATINSNLEEEYVNVSHLYSEDKKMTMKLLATVEDWAKEHGINKMGGVTKREPKAWERKFGYKLLSYNMVKEI